MTIAYSSGIPNPPNNPADDVATMKSNAGAISNIIAIDHVGFNVAGGGQHNRVTFNANLPPSFPTSFPIIFRNNQDGAASPNTLPIPAPFVALGNGTFNSATQNIVSGQGSAILFAGIIVKWGVYTLAGGVPSAPVAFASAFPNNVYALTFGSNVSGSAGDLPIYSSLTKDGFTGGRVSSAPLGGTYTYYYIAIGN